MPTQFLAPLRHIAQQLGAETPSSPRSFDLVFDDDLSVTVWLHPNDRELAVDIWCFDAAPVAGVPREAMVDALLRLNVIVQQAEAPCALGLDNRDLVVLHARIGLAALEQQDLVQWLSSLLDQGRRVRSLVTTLCLQAE